MRILPTLRAQGKAFIGIALVLLSEVALFPQQVTPRKSTTDPYVRAQRLFEDYCLEPEGNENFDPRRCREAATAFQGRIARYPRDAKARYYYGSALVRLAMHGRNASPSDAEDGRAALRKSIELDRLFFPAYYELSGAVSGPEAVQLLEALLKVDPKQEQAYQVLILLLSRPETTSDLMRIYKQYRVFVPLMGDISVQTDIDVARSLTEFGKMALSENS